ncbi:hypothetical protein [Rubellimicrobium aerolatum]|uniref:Tyr recombinase domain-containing protein n=1 Tax=Rubellimicrobium aerolatum TaxID=490979 RepID=A0ABW0S8P2_9RHOB|nr:hypothetical protein [Rubellimicrobium aerolatum]MBP1804664.1 integrase [Rubellimicrobium aerolatum]
MKMKMEMVFPGLCKEKSNIGTPRWRVRVEGDKTQKITIPVGPGHRLFEDCYKAARAGKKVTLKELDKPSRGTLDELREKYVEAMTTMIEAGKMSELTKSGRERGLRQACDVEKKGVRIGSLKANLPEEAFNYILDSFGAQTGAAETCLKALKAAYTWGKGRGFPKDSAVFELASPHKGRGGATPWTDEDEAQFLRHHGTGTMARRWFYLAKNMAGRIGDTHVIGPKQIKLKDGHASLAWQPRKKGSKPVEVPVMTELAQELNVGPSHPEAFLLTEYGRPFASSGALGNKIRDWVIQAGLVKTVEVKSEGNVWAVKKAARSQHGIRKRVAEQIAEAGGTEYEIMARLSHSDPKTAAIYTAKVNRKKLTKSGFERVEGRTELV